MDLKTKIEEDSRLLQDSQDLNNYFKSQLSLIKNEMLRLFIAAYISNQEKFKMEGATSSTGKYHPEWQNGYGGNGRHTKNVVKILQVFERAYPDLDWDSLYAAGILHDMSKYNKSDDKHTNSNHPKIEADKLWTYFKLMGPDDLKKKQVKFICNLIQFHDGRFNNECATKEQINSGYTKGMRKKLRHVENYILHSADMISANKSLWDEVI